MAQYLPSQQAEGRGHQGRSIVLCGLLALFGAFALLIGPALSGIASASYRPVARVVSPAGAPAGQNSQISDANQLASLRVERAVPASKRMLAQDGPSAILNERAGLDAPVFAPSTGSAPGAAFRPALFAFDARGPPQQA